ncbi:MAG: DUF2058 family protein [Luteimonas sp.]|nr:DUF2058 family protein [Luteimonas sp.]
MSDTLRDQLLGLGFKPAPKPEKPARPAAKDAAAPQRKAHPGKPQGARPEQRKPADIRHQAGKPHGSARHAGRPRSQEDIDLAKAYAIRAQKEKQERIDAERDKQEAARLRREAKAKFAEFVKDKALNDPNADIARHFDYGGKIKRVYVTEAQLKALNSGELGVAQLDGRYLLLPSAVLAEAETIFPAAIALKVDPDAPAGDDPYADPQYQVPDDLVW